MSLPGEEPDLFISTASRDKGAVELLNAMFKEAADQGASDIHMEDEPGQTRIRYRVQGSMFERGRIPRTLAMDMQNKIRMRAKLALSDIRKPLDGRFGLRYAGEYDDDEASEADSSDVSDRSLRLDIRVSLQPTVYGQSVVCRLLDQRNTARRLDDIEMTSAVRDWINILIREPHGLFLVTGPTGSGKTTTLYGIINELNDDSRKIVTIEDPVEYRVSGLMQTSIEGGLTFAEVLRETLRQDPDIILVGEMRDQETAQIGLRAAMTGHLVLSTLHTNDAISSPVRLIDMGTPRYMVAMSLLGVVAQRLVRLVCESCAEPYVPLPFEHEWLKLELGDGVDDHAYVRGQGCSHCNGMGYQGRVGVYELLEMNLDLTEATNHHDPNHFVRIARQQIAGETMRKHAVDLVVAGRTTVAEAMRISNQMED